VNIKSILFLSVLTITLSSQHLGAAETNAPKETLSQSSCAATLDFSFRQLSNAKRVNLCKEYQGKLILIVNTASRCGFTPQFESLEKLYQNYKNRGFVVLGFPSNDFGSQELSEEKDIASFCQLTYGVKFPMFEKTHASKELASPLYKTLGELSGEYPQWNFHKYLIGRDGKMLASLASHVLPDGKELNDLINKNL
jgi:glutathione peroxidase